MVPKNVGGNSNDASGSEINRLFNSKDSYVSPFSPHTGERKFSET